MLTDTMPWNIGYRRVEAMFAPQLSILVSFSVEFFRFNGSTLLTTIIYTFVHHRQIKILFLTSLLIKQWN